MRIEGLVPILAGLLLWLAAPMIARFQVSWKWGQGFRDSPLTLQEARRLARGISIGMIAIGVWMLFGA